MKVLIADKFPEGAVERFTGAGFDVMYNPDLKAEALEAEIKKSKAEAVVVRSTKVTEPMLEDSHLSLVIRAGSGYDTIDVGACSKRFRLRHH
jgi:D-3-phosphoglycerate dehydrogenase